jgi:hypothetical protein
MLHVPRIVLLSAATCLLATPAALAQTSPSGDSVTATGTGQSLVKPTNRHRNASIVAAYAAAEKAAITSAMASAQASAQAYAAAGGLTLGSIQSISDTGGGGGGYFYGPGPEFGPFGPNQFCGTERIARVSISKQGSHVRKVVHFRTVHRCIVPRYAFLTLVVTYSASPTSSSSTTTG